MALTLRRHRSSSFNHLVSFTTPPCVTALHCTHVGQLEHLLFVDRSQPSFLSDSQRPLPLPLPLPLFVSSQSCSEDEFARSLALVQRSLSKSRIHKRLTKEPRVHRSFIPNPPLLHPWMQQGRLLEAPRQAQAVAFLHTCGPTRQAGSLATRLFLPPYLCFLARVVGVSNAQRNPSVVT